MADGDRLDRDASTGVEGIIEAGPQSASSRGPTQEAHRVRFSQDVERQVVPGPVDHSTQHVHQPSLAIDTSPEAVRSSPRASILPSRQGVAPPKPSRTRDRGYSLRRTLFARRVNDQSEENGFELADAGLSRQPIGEKDQVGGGGPDVSPILESDIGKPPSGETLSDSSPKRNREKTKSSQTIPLGHSTQQKKNAGNGALAQKIKRCRKAVLDVLLRRKEIPPSKDGRHIDLDASRTHDLTDERTGREYIGNTIRSSRYTVWNFLPRQLFFQFSKLANAYFLLVSILQMIPGLSTVGNYTTLAPLLVFVAISMAKEGYDDVRRYNLDQVENKKTTQVFHSYRPTKKTRKSKLGFSRTSAKTWKGRVRLSDGSHSSIHKPGPEPLPPSGALKLWATLKWREVKVGDIIKLDRDDDAPADIVLLHATGPNGIAYIETMALDGETNLKSKQASPCLSKRCSTIDAVAACRAHIVVEDPNIDLYNFDGRVMIDGETLPLTTNEVVFRGSTLRNTTYAIGMVINTGEDCKIRMNANKNPRIKAPAIQTITNKIIIALVFFVVLLSLFCSVGYKIWSDQTEDKAWYLDNASVPYSQIIIGFIILYNTLIPLSLYVSLEIIKIGQLVLMADVEMYDPISNTPMVCNTTTILENLGQVDYVFSDKTGTLTDNVMRFRKLSVAGYAWLHDFDLQKDAAELEQKTQSMEKEKQKSKGKGKGKGIAKHFVKAESPRLQTKNEPEQPTSPLRRSESIWRSSARPTKAQQEFRTEELLRYMQHKPHSVFTKKVKFFILSLALCHTCLPEVQENGEIDFQAASPDELALVKAAQDLGWLMIDRPAQSITLNYPGRSDSTDSAESVTESYEVLDVIEFSSKRKRMSIIVRFPNGKICIICKGADSAILPRLKLASLALQKVAEITRRTSVRKSLEAEEALRRLSEHSPRSSYSRPSMSRPHPHRRSTGAGRPSIASTRLRPIKDENGVSPDGHRRGSEVVSDDASAYESARSSLYRESFASYDRRGSYNQEVFQDDMIDEGLVLDESVVFERCFQQLDDFATEGLRTLLYGYRFLDEEEYRNWKQVYVEATTSLVDRQDRIENAGEMIEQHFDLAGATAIEDKLQKGVPETIDKLRRANIKIWMLTGDKRETAINIAHSARLCKNYSEVVILDHVTGDVEQRMASTLLDLDKGHFPHTVVVVDGQTLAEINGNETLAPLFFDLVVRTDSVICCRASPSQKASLVKQIRTKVNKSITLAIGDGANDIAMIQEAHVGIGISGKEGLQAARISDYSIAQFRFLQRLLLVHGRWNYVRTGKYILATFWKELVFYLVQALYQRWNGYTGTSLFESTSLTVFNSLFTSLAVILLGMFEQDLEALTLLAVPELYSWGQRSRSFNIKKYLGWMVMATSEAMVIYFCMWGLYARSNVQENQDVLSIGTMCFAASVIFINIKCLLLETHHKTIIPIAGFIISVGGWWIWTIALSGIYKPTYKTTPLYHLHDGFIKQHGRDLAWWAVLFLTLASVTLLELGVGSIRKTYWPTDTDIFQVLQKDPAIRKRFQDTLRREEAGMNSEADGRAYGQVEGPEEDLQSPTNDKDGSAMASPVELKDASGWRYLTRRKKSVDHTSEVA